MSVAVFIRHQTQPGRRDEVHAAWQEHMAPAIAANPGHEAYFYCYDDADRDAIVVFQQYVDAAASRAFLDSDAYLAYLAATEPMLAGPPVVTVATPIWQK